MNSEWVELRAGTRMHGRLHVGRMLLEVKQGGLTVCYDLTATAQARHAIFDRVRVSTDKPEEGVQKLSGNA